MTERNHKVAVHNAIADVARRMTDDTETEAWLRNLNVQLVDVWMYVRHEWVGTRQVNDSMTLLEVIDMERLRLNASHAVWFNGEEWCLRGAGPRQRFYATREQAEMVAIHNG